MNVEVVIILFCVLGIALVVAFVAGVRENKQNRKKLERGEISVMPVVNPADMECCGQHEVCEKESLLAAISKQIEYYDDEELDRFKGREERAYTEEEEEEFRSVLYTMKNEEVAGWVRSLQLRGIALPEGVKEEVLLIVRERRYGE